MRAYKRNSTLIKTNFFRFLLPTILSILAISLNEFVDSILVSALLGNRALCLVNMGFPVMLVFAFVYTIIGIGGSVVYAEYSGKQEAERARRLFTCTFAASLVFSVVLVLAGLIFLKQLAALLCAQDALLPEFIGYLRILIISGILIIPLQVLISFFPAFGYPGIATSVNIIANAVNLLLDFVYIRFFSTGVKGSALATLTGYAVGIMILILFVLMKRCVLPFAGFGRREIQALPSILIHGMAPAVNQLGYCIKITFCNNLATTLGGIGGMTAFSVCMQTLSMLSILIGGVISAMLPIAAALKGQGDLHGIRLLMRTVLLVQLISNLLLVALIELFPQIIITMFSVESAYVEMTVEGLRIFTVMCVFRGIVLVFMYYFQVTSWKIYALILGVIDGFAGIIPLALLLTSFMGIQGLWFSFPLLSFIMMIGIFLVNHMIAQRSGGRYKGIFLYEYEDPDLPVYDSTVPLKPEAISENASLLERFCRENHLSGKLSILVAVSFEEMSVYTMEQKEKNYLETIDLLVKIVPNEVVMDIRSIGKPFDLTAVCGEDFGNVDILRKTATSIDYNYITGMNLTRIRLTHGERKRQYGSRHI